MLILQFGSVCHTYVYTIASIVSELALALIVLSRSQQSKFLFTTNLELYHAYDSLESHVFHHAPVSPVSRFSYFRLRSRQHKSKVKKHDKHRYWHYWYTISLPFLLKHQSFSSTRILSLKTPHEFHRSASEMSLHLVCPYPNCTQKNPLQE